MAYTSKYGLGYLNRASNAFDTAENIAAAIAVHGEYYVSKPCSIQEFQFYVTTAIQANLILPQVIVKQRVTPGSDTGAVTIATITLPTGTAAGKVLVKRFAPYQLNVGDTLTFQHTVLATDSGTAAGAGFYDVTLHVDEESDLNQGDLIVSA